MILGAIFGGGLARRFGGDKAAAAIDGVALIDRVAEALRPQCDALVVVGRNWPGMEWVEDIPAPGLGPLGALAGALTFAQTRGFRAVLTSGCDLPDIPGDLLARLSSGPAVVRGQPLLGLWPSDQLAGLLAHIEMGARALQGWVERSGAALIAIERPIPNINTRDDLARYEAQRGLRPEDRRSSP